MIKLLNNTWESSDVADSLTKQLFSKEKRSEKVNKPAKRKKNVKKQHLSTVLNDNNTVNLNAQSANIKPILQSKEKTLNITAEQELKNNVDDKKIIAPKKKSKTKKLNRQNELVSKEIVPDNEIKLRANLRKEMKTKKNKKLRKKMLKLGEQEDEKINVKKLKQLLSLKQCESAMDKPVSLRDRMIAQLKASRFRFLNETLYKNDSSESKKLFKEDPQAFTAYHEGYRQQVEQWPLNPLDVIIKSIRKMPKDYIIADFGCGDARLASSVAQKVHSFDLVAINEKVTACDMAHTPLLMSGVNVVVFCLSLMGTNLNDYLREANRVLKKDGILKIAEVESRFGNIEEFVKLLESFGFKNTWRDLSHNLFYFMDFKKISDITNKSSKLPQITLKPCLYKKR